MTGHRSADNARSIGNVDSVPPCPACGGNKLRQFYSVERIPCHSVLLMETREQALSYPRGDLQLAFCESCGFVFNSGFDADTNDYSVSYEETQHFSRRFHGFAHQLATELIEDYDIRGQRILEIGCGKGEFLGLMCELGGNFGIGIDPGCRPERFPEQWRDRIEVHQELYSQKHAQLQADAVFCRHTLEHIGPVQDFLQTIRNTLQGRPQTLVFFEVPDIRIVLEQTRFWDIYYEHSSYFSLGSLGRLFERCGFHILELKRAFDDQYALLVARPAEINTLSNDHQVDDVAALQDLVTTFEAASQVSIENWRQRLQQYHLNEKRVVVWGAGSKCVAFLTTIGLMEEIDYVVDINPFKQGRFLPGTGHQVHAPEFLRKQPPDVVILMNSIYTAEVQTQLNEMGLAPELIPL